MANYTLKDYLADQNMVGDAYGVIRQKSRRWGEGLWYSEQFRAMQDRYIIGVDPYKKKEVCEQKIVAVMSRDEAIDSLRDCFMQSGMLYEESQKKAVEWVNNCDKSPVRGVLHDGRSIEIKRTPMFWGNYEIIVTQDSWQPTPFTKQELREEEVANLRKEWSMKPHMPELAKKLDEIQLGYLGALNKQERKEKIMLLL